MKNKTIAAELPRRFLNSRLRLVKGKQRVSEMEPEMEPVDDQYDAFANVGQGLVGEHKTAMLQYWQQAIDDIERISDDGSDQDVFKSTVLPLARIKKVMKTDLDVKMISAEAPILFAKGCDIFITELTMRAWIHAEENKRRTLQRSDIAMAIQKSDVFDFLIDIIPREEAQPRRAALRGQQTYANDYNESYDQGFQRETSQSSSLPPEQMQMMGQIPGQMPNQLPNQLPSQITPNQLSSQLPAPLPNQIPGQLPAPLPGQMQEQIPNQMPGASSSLPNGEQSSQPPAENSTNFENFRPRAGLDNLTDVVGMADLPYMENDKSKQFEFSNVKDERQDAPHFANDLPFSYTESVDVSQFGQNF